MPVVPQPTPNPNALKFAVGVDVGGPATYTLAAEVDDPLAAALLAIEGVMSVFMTADFVTLSKEPNADWAAISPAAQELLQEHYGV